MRLSVSNRKVKNLVIFVAIGVALAGVAAVTVTYTQNMLTSTVPQPPATGTGADQTLANFLDQLRSKGASVQSDGKIQQDIFSLNPTLVMVNGEDVWVFEFPSQTDAKEQVDHLSPNGTMVGNRNIHLLRAPPHFYQHGRLVVFYEGSNQAIMDLLEFFLGPQVAGKTTG